MEQIFIMVTRGEKIYHINLLDSTKEERNTWYNTLSKGQIYHISEQFITNKIMEKSRI